IQGFVAAVPEANKDAYKKHAEEAFQIFKEFGVTRMVESWEEDVPDGEVTDHRRAVKAEPGEKIVFSWFEYPSKDVADAAEQKMMSDPRFEQMGKMPFDGKRMIYGGFETIADTGSASGTDYINGTVIPVTTTNKQAYTASATAMGKLFVEHGATRVVDGWGVNVPEGKVTDFQRSVQATADETVGFGWVEWPSKEASDAGWKTIMADPRMQANEMPFDAKRMIFGGFTPLLDMR
ncbi:MAG: DUF1428 domain-containing protein, partial [Henriciella sp.]|uniref:DUF1428 domain-containing protein n=1 Tax=Henriciella sp. TaxID=1968823 RepID=UPI003C748FC9